MMMMKWQRDVELLQAAGNDQRCLVLMCGQLEILSYNHYYQVWDSADGDDYFCTLDDKRIELYAVLPPVEEVRDYVANMDKILMEWSKASPRKEESLVTEEYQSGGDDV